MSDRGGSRAEVSEALISMRWRMISRGWEGEYDGPGGPFLLEVKITTTSYWLEISRKRDSEWAFSSKHRLSGLEHLHIVDILSHPAFLGSMIEKNFGS